MKLWRKVLAVLGLYRESSRVSEKATERRNLLERNRVACAIRSGAVNAVMTRSAELRNVAAELKDKEASRNGKAKGIHRAGFGPLPG